MRFYLILGPPPHSPRPPVAIVVRVSWWRRMRARLRAMFHRCQLTIFDTDEGIGGRCIDCGRIYGWMSRAELGRLSIGQRVSLLRQNLRDQGVL